jgi:exosome complex component CSL4
MASDLCLPGQPIPIPRGPTPAIGAGTYARDGQIRASVVGVPRYEGSVRPACPHARTTRGSRPRQ